MLKLTSSTRIFCATAPADFRKGIDGLQHYCQTLTAQPFDAKSGALIVFINKSRTMIRVLSYDGTGFWLATKRLSQGRFQGWPSATQPLSNTRAEQLLYIIVHEPKQQKAAKVLK
jgi:hypothetical protein